ncbi:hypothetical protein V5799_020631 [Amblyomma americanum]|uniref:THAP-type domain-containing protein n=1 Tax=Amblyomma americanum TaxID=6943 RepID=A0AAQ4ETW4_AMBAM
MKCYVPGFRSRTKEHRPGVSFHRFPKDPKLKTFWREALERDGTWTPSKWSCVCSIHYKSGDFMVSGRLYQRPCRQFHRQLLMWPQKMWTFRISLLLWTCQVTCQHRKMSW